MYRFAASLSRDMHIDDLRVALLNFIAARQSGESFLLRLEDMDFTHYEEGKDKELVELLTLFGIQYDQLNYQSENLKFHQQLATKLLIDQKAFSCFCTPDTLKRKEGKAAKNNSTYHYDGTCKNLSDAEVLNNESPFMIRIKRPEGETLYTDICKGTLRFSPEEIDDFVILNIDKTSTPTFATAIDDMMFDVSTVIGNDTDTLETAREIVVRDYLGYDKEIRYAHLPKLDINNDIPTVKALVEEGYLPSAITNYLLSLSFNTPEEIFTLDEAIAWFNIENLNKEPAGFDIEKLKELNRKHIMIMDAKTVSTRIGYSSEDFGKLAQLLSKETPTLQEIKAKIDKIFAPKVCEDLNEEFEKLKDIAKKAPYCPTFEEFLAYLEKQSGLNEEQLFKLLPILLTGEAQTLDISEIYLHIKNYLGEIIK